MRMHASECARMHLTVGSHLTYTREAERTQGQTWTDMGWTGCGRARRRANVAPMCHYMPSDTVIVAAGKTVDQIKMMHVMEKQKHAEACNKNRSISATSVNELATKWGWMFLHKL